MDGAMTKEQAAAHWRRDLEEAEASSRQAWPRDVTAGMSEFEWLTLKAKILEPVLGQLVLAFQERNRQFEPADQEEAGAPSINQTFSVILAAAMSTYLPTLTSPRLRKYLPYLAIVLRQAPVSLLAVWRCGTFAAVPLLAPATSDTSTKGSVLRL